jgi:hypothetical protein
MVQRKHDRFPTTRWHLLSVASNGDPQERKAAIGELLKMYQKPIRGFVASRRGVRHHEIEDIVHDFVTLKWLEQDFLAKALPERGKFRWFLTVSLGRFVSNWLRDSRGRQNGTEEVPVAELSAPGNEVDGFDQEWAKLVLENAIERFRAECEKNQRSDIWEIFEGRVLKPSMYRSEPISYRELVTRLSLRSPAHAQNLLITAKRGFIRAVKESVATYESDPEAQEEEIADLLRILKG